jgi:SAM-dependent methyltransferase
VKSGLNGLSLARLDGGLLKKLFVESLRGKTPGRIMLENELEHLDLRGVVLDLGGRPTTWDSRFSATFYYVNLETIHPNGIVANLEEGVPIRDEVADNVVCIAVLEHIFNHEKLLCEARRCLKPDGRLYLTVPLIVRYHPTPEDYHRHTAPAIVRMLVEAGFKDIYVKALGLGSITAGLSLMYPVRKIKWFGAISTIVAATLDRAISLFTEYNSALYFPIIYIAQAQK